jgi:peptide deformylase
MFLASPAVAGAPVTTTPPTTTPATASATTATTTPASVDSIVQIGAVVLRARAADVEPAAISTPAMQALVERMVAAMRSAPGVGLAAPQLGVPLRVFVMEDTASRMQRLTPQEIAERERVPVPLRVVFNPQVTPVGRQTRVFFEGCLSVAGFSALVPRFHEVELTGLDERGQPLILRLRGWPARIVQHELDHLDGTLYVDRMWSRSFGTTPQVLERFGGRPIADVAAELGLPPSP